MKHYLLVLSIVLLAMTAAIAAPKKSTHAVSIDNMAFSPASVQVTVGDTVEWTNNDERDHNVTSKDGSFKSGNLSNGASYRYTFNKAGKFSYGCSLHPRMKGTVTVSN